MAKVTSPPSAAPVWSRPAWAPRSGRISALSAAARSTTSLRMGSVSAVPGAALARVRVLGPWLQLDLDLPALAVAEDLQGDGLARALAGDQLGEVALADQLLPRDGEDDVAARLDRGALEGPA